MFRVLSKIVSCWGERWAEVKSFLGINLEKIEYLELFFSTHLSSGIEFFLLCGIKFLSELSFPAALGKSIEIKLFCYVYEIYMSMY